MNQVTKRIFIIVLATFLCFHFGMVFLYSSPMKFNNKKLDFINHLYVYPVFHQNWALFVPAPNEKRKLFVRYKTNQQFSDWQDIMGNEIIHHKSNRLSGGEAKVLLFSNSLIYELNYLIEKKSFTSSIVPSNNEFKVLEFEVAQYLKSKFDCRNTMYQMLLVTEGADKTRAYFFQALTVN